MEKLEVSAPGGGGSVVSTLQEEIVEDTSKAAGSVVSCTTDDQLFDKIEVHLLEKINAGDKAAPFLLGQFYYEEVCEKALLLITAVVFY